MGLPMPTCKYCDKPYHFERVDGDYGYIVRSCSCSFLKIKLIKLINYLKRMSF